MLIFNPYFLLFNDCIWLGDIYLDAVIVVEGIGECGALVVVHVEWSLVPLSILFLPFRVFLRRPPPPPPPPELLELLFIGVIA